jgi:hypothetical protein
VATGRSDLPAGPIKALAFNTLLSSQETDTHRAGPAFAFPAPGRLFDFIRSARSVNSGLFRFAFPVPLPRALPGDAAISSDPARLSKSGLFRSIPTMGTAKPFRLDL